MFFDERRSHFLKDRLQRRLKAVQVDSFYSYYRLLTAAKVARNLRLLLENLTVNETSFFFATSRNFDLLQKTVLEELLRQKTGTPRLDVARVECGMLLRAGSLLCAHSDLRRLGLLLSAKSAALRHAHAQNR